MHAEINESVLADRAISSLFRPTFYSRRREGGRWWGLRNELPISLIDIGCGLLGSGD